MTYRRNDTVLYYGEKCIVVDVFGTTVFIQSIASPCINYEVSVTSSFLEKTEGVKKYFQKINLITR